MKEKDFQGLLEAVREAKQILRGEKKAARTFTVRIREKLMSSKPELHPEILTKNGRKEFAVLPYEEFIALQEWLDDLEDLLDLRSAKEAEHDAPTISLTEIESRLDKTN